MGKIKKNRTHYMIAIAILLGSMTNTNSFFQHTRSQIKQTIQRIKRAYSRMPKRKKEATEKGVVATCIIMAGSSISYLAYVLRKRTNIFHQDPVNDRPKARISQKSPQEQDATKITSSLVSPPETTPPESETKTPKAPAAVGRRRWARAAAVGGEATEAFLTMEDKGAKAKEEKDPKTLFRELKDAIKSYNLDSASTALIKLGKAFSTKKRKYVLRKLIAKLYSDLQVVSHLDDGTCTKISCILWDLALNAREAEALLSKESRCQLHGVYKACHNKTLKSTIKDLSLLPIMQKSRS